MANKPNLLLYDDIRARLSEIGYLDPETSSQALESMRLIFQNLWQGKLVISRKATDAKGNVGIFTAFDNPKPPTKPPC